MESISIELARARQRAHPSKIAQCHDTGSFARAFQHTIIAQDDGFKGGVAFSRSMITIHKFAAVIGAQLAHSGTQSMLRMTVSGEVWMTFQEVTNLR